MTTWGFTLEMLDRTVTLGDYGTVTVPTALTVALVVLGALAAGAIVTGATAQQTADDGLSGTATLSETDAKLSGEGAYDGAGTSVASAGDVNGDGVNDLIVGAPANDTGGTNAGAAYVVYGPADPDEVSLADADVKLVGAGSFDRAGTAVSTAGDVNDDGYADVVVGAPGNDTAAPNAGAAYVVHGDESLPSELNLSEADATLHGEASFDRAGWSVSDTSAVADVSGVVVGAPYHDDASGAAYVVAGDDVDGTVDLAANATATVTGESAGDQAGWSVSHAGDVNGDGVADLVVGAPGWTADGNETARDETARAGAAYVVTGDRYGEFAGETTLSEAWVRATGVDARDRAGWSVSNAGDVNDDGLDDVVVGAPFADPNATTSAGTASIVYGAEERPEDLSLADANVTLSGEGERDRAGLSVSSAGSSAVGCDDHGDVVVGAPRNDTAGNESGAAYLVGGSDALAGNVSLGDAHATVYGEGEGDRAGAAVADAGDVTNDTFVDVAVGAPENDTRGLNDTGAAYVLHGDCPERGDETPTERPVETPTRTPTETSTATPTPPQLESVNLTLSETNLTVNESTNATVNATYDDGSTENVTENATIDGENESIVSVNGSNVTAVGAGETNVTAEFDGETDAVAVNVTEEEPALESIDLALEGTNLTENESTNATVNATYADNSTEDVTDDAMLSSENTSVATVENGTVSAVGPGDATITALFENESDAVSVTVTEDEPELASIDLELADASLTVGNDTTASVNATYDDASTADVTAEAEISSDDTDVATVSGATVTTEGEGTANVTAEYENETDLELLEVSEANQPPTADAGSDQTVNASEAVTLDATGSSDPDGDDLTYAWTQTDGPDVTLDGATNESATLTAPDVDETATLTFEVQVTDEDGATDTDSVTVTVEPVEMEDLEGDEVDGEGAGEDEATEEAEDAEDDVDDEGVDGEDTDADAGDEAENGDEGDAEDDGSDGDVADGGSEE